MTGRYPTYRRAPRDSVNELANFVEQEARVLRTQSVRISSESYWLGSLEAAGGLLTRFGWTPVPTNRVVRQLTIAASEASGGSVSDLITLTLYRKAASTVTEATLTLSHLGSAGWRTASKTVDVAYDTDDTYWLEIVSNQATNRTHSCNVTVELEEFVPPLQ